MLETKHHNVEFAIDGKGALEWIKNQMFDLILLDVMMPGLNGFDVCKKLRSNPKYDDVPIIFLTAEVDKSSIVEGFKLGAQDYVTKPFDTRELLARVNTHLELRHSREKLKSVNRWLEEKVKERTLELKKANEELLHLDNAKTEFLSIISHEIRTPLNGIVGPLKLLKDRIGSGDLTELLNILDISVTRLEKFSLAALTITSLRTQKQPIKRQAVVLEDLLDDALTEYDEKIREKDLKIKREMLHGKPEISGDHGLLKICMVNILSNAVKYSNKGGEILIRTGKNGEGIYCTISDEGPGFSEEALNKLFRLFAPGEQHINMNIGLDLALVKMIVDAHDARIEIKNNKNAGASVKLIFKAGDGMK